MVKDMLRYAAFLLKSVYDAEDAVHTVFLHAMQKWNVLADMEEKDKKNYLFAAVRNAALDIIRRKRRAFISSSFSSTAFLIAGRNR